VPKSSWGQTHHRKGTSGGMKKLIELRYMCANAITCFLEVHALHNTCKASGGDFLCLFWVLLVPSFYSSSVTLIDEVHF